MKGVHRRGRVKCQCCHSVLSEHEELIHDKLHHYEELTIVT